MINKGSEWNIWDLHVHTPASIFHRFGNADDVWENYILDLENLSPNFKVIGINDYFFIDGYERLLNEQIENGRLKNLLLIPVLEFRIEKFAGVDFENLKRINFHVILSPDLSLETIKSQFLNTLEQSYTLATDGSQWTRAITKKSVEELGNKIKEGIPSAQLHKYGSDLLEGFNNLNLNEDQILKSLDKDCFTGKYLIAVGKTEWDELKWTDASIATKKSIINNADIVFTASASVENYKKAKEKLRSNYVNDFLFDCSDAHSFSNIIAEKDRIGNCLNWLKSDISFDGLRQTLIEKEDRLFVGDEPQILKNLTTKRTKYIDSIKINQLRGYDESEGVWFKDVEIPLNKELVVIIGNKGKGKSALADIISLCGNYKGSNNDFSFLKPTRFNEKQGKIAKNFEAQITWLSGSVDKKYLNDRVSEDAVENVKYLPQGYFESLTNDHESIDDFNKEIENVVFTHLSENEKLGKNSFKELIEFQTTVSNEEINSLKLRLNIINKSLFEKEKKLNPIYQTTIEKQIEKKQEELKALIEPPLVHNPNDDPKIAALNLETNNLLEKINKEIEDNDVRLRSTLEKKGSLLIDINKLKVVKQRIENKLTELENFKIEIKQELSSYSDLSFDDFIKINSDLTTLSLLIDSKEVEYKICKINLGEEQNVDDSSFKSIPKVIEDLNKKKLEIQDKLGEADKIYQKYLSDIKNWENNKQFILGDSDTNGTLVFLNNELKYLKEKLELKIEKDRTDRIDLTNQIYKKKESVLSIYKNVKKEIDKIITENKFLLDAYPIKIEASFKIKSNFKKKFFEFISLNKLGTYYGKDNAEKQLKNILDLNNIDSFDGIKDLLDSTIKSLFTDLRDNSESKTNIENQINEVVAFYDYVFSLEFVDFNYELKQGTKRLDQLSPGEKGALLLIFYLLLDNNDVPLIIDQPEDNLDNHSVANILVPFIKKAKSKRQIILVTHNPNLAVVADAEQVIFTDLDKENNYTFSFKAGAIENPVINECIVKVLEGAMPAFNKRKMKYYENK